MGKTVTPILANPPRAAPCLRPEEAIIAQAHPDLAITAAELAALRRWLHPQFLKASQAFFEDKKNEIMEMEKHELELARRRLKIKTDPGWVSVLLERQKLLPETDWDNPKFEQDAFSARCDERRGKIEKKYRAVGAYLHRMFPSILDFASFVAAFERTVPSSKKLADERVVSAIVKLVFARPSIEVPPVLGTQVDARFSAEQVWDLFRAHKEPRRLLSQKIENRLRTELAQMAEDRRSREELVDACLDRHRGYADDGCSDPGLTHKNIAAAAHVRINDFYQWRRSHPRIGPKKHRRILFVVLSPVWPPPQLPAER